MRHAVALVLTAVAAALWGLSAVAIHGLAAEYGADVFADGLSAAVLVAVPASLALLCLVGARDPLRRPRPRTSVLAVGVLVLFAATGAAAVAHGGSVHERDRAVIGTACSSGDVALLAAVDAPGARSEPAGEPDGGCSVVVSSEPDVASAVAEVTAALERGGWQRTAQDGDERVFERADDVLRLSAVSDGKVTDVRLTLR